MLLDHLGLGIAHFGTSIPRDISGMAAEHPERLAGIVLCVPSRLDPARPLPKSADRILMISGEHGPAAEANARAAATAALRQAFGPRRLLGAWELERRRSRANRRDRRTDDRFPGIAPRRCTACGRAQGGIHAGISYRIEGAGPALILLPFFLAPSQWDPAIPRLAECFNCGHDRRAVSGWGGLARGSAQMASYQAMFRTPDRHDRAAARGDILESAAVPDRSSGCWRDASGPPIRSPPPM